MQHETNYPRLSPRFWQIPHFIPFCVLLYIPSIGKEERLENRNDVIDILSLSLARPPTLPLLFFLELQPKCMDAILGFQLRVTFWSSVVHPLSYSFQRRVQLANKITGQLPLFKATTKFLQRWVKQSWTRSYLWSSPPQGTLLHGWQALEGILMVNKCRVKGK